MKVLTSEASSVTHENEANEASSFDALFENRVQKSPVLTFPTEKNFILNLFFILLQVVTSERLLN